MKINVRNKTKNFTSYRASRVKSLFNAERGDIAYQDWCWIPKVAAIDPKKWAKIIWSDELLPMGVSLIKNALSDISAGIIRAEKQRADVSTYEPAIEKKDIFRPDCLMIEQKSKKWEG
jgi:methionyl-tRNA formyltransferase